MIFTIPFTTVGLQKKMSGWCSDWSLKWSDFRMKRHRSQRRDAVSYNWQKMIIYDVFWVNWNGCTHVRTRDRGTKTSHWLALVFSSGPHTQVWTAGGKRPSCSHFCSSSLLDFPTLATLSLTQTPLQRYSSAWGGQKRSPFSPAQLSALLAVRLHHSHYVPSTTNLRHPIKSHGHLPWTQARPITDLRSAEYRHSSAMMSHQLNAGTVKQWSRISLTQAHSSSDRTLVYWT